MVRVRQTLIWRLETALVGAVLVVQLLIYWQVLRDGDRVVRALQSQEDLEGRVDRLMDRRAPHIRATFEVGGVQYVVETPKLAPDEPFDVWMARHKAALDSAQRSFR